MAPELAGFVGVCPAMTAVASGKPLNKSLVRAGIKYTQFSLVGASNALVDLGVFNLILTAGPRPASQFAWPSTMPWR